MTPAVKNLCEWASQALEHIEGLDDPSHENYPIGHHVSDAIKAVESDPREALVQEVIAKFRHLASLNKTNSGYTDHREAEDAFFYAGRRLAEWKGGAE